MSTQREGYDRPPSAPFPRKLTFLTADADHRVALFGSLLISVWIHETKIEALRAMGEAIEVSARGVPHGRLALFVVVEPNAKMPSTGAREELTRLRRTSSITLTALVHEGNGFSAALVRGITTSLNLLERAENQTHVFATVATAARWLEAKAPQYGEANAIEAAVAALRTSSV